MRTRTIFILLVFTGMLIACHHQRGQIPSDVVNIPNTASGSETGDHLPAITFKETTHDFGKVIQGEVVTYSFRFTNTGDADLLISNVSASCGCTATSYPHEPIKPGDEEFITVTFDSAGRTGYQYKTVTIAANTQPNTAVVNIKAEVIIPERD